MARISKLNVDRSGGLRKPHKPLLLLLALAHWIRTGNASVGFAEIEAPLRALLELYAPPVQAAHQPKYPFWYLRSDGVWEIPGEELLARDASGFPTLRALRGATGRIPQRHLEALAASPALARRAVRTLLSAHFEPSLHVDILEGLGLDALWAIDFDAPAEVVAENAMPRYERLARPAGFRDSVLAAYDRRCAVTGFQALLGTTLFALEAAHVHWHSQGGPSSVDNGLALEPTLHRLFDHGAWSLTDDRKVLVSRAFSGSDVALERLRSLHRRPIRTPAPGHPAVGVDFIRWHREPGRGGVFRAPAID